MLPIAFKVAAGIADDDGEGEGGDDRPGDCLQEKMQMWIRFDVVKM